MNKRPRRWLIRIKKGGRLERAPLPLAGTASYIFVGLPSGAHRRRRPRRFGARPGVKEVKMNFEKFTERARGFVQSAQSLAVREGNQQFTPEHLLKVRQQQ
jgi:hypothetical protein